jgi:hypothetical protein
LRKRSFRFLVFGLAALALIPRAAQAQEDGYPFRLVNFSFEFLGGASKMAPADLNSLASYEEAYLQYYYAARFNYYHGLYGDSYQVQSARTGAAPFAAIRDALSYGVRLRYNLSPSLALSLGVQFLSRNQPSSVGLKVDVVDGSRDYVDYGGTVSYQYQNSGFLLGASAWIPQLAAHFGWQLGSVLRLEILVAGGPLFAECRTVSERRMSVTDASGYQSGSLVRTEMTGKGTGISMELGGRFCAKTAGFLDFFVEGSFAFRDSTLLTGSGSSRSVVIDSNAQQDPVLQSWSGDWGMIQSSITSSWGKFTQPMPQDQIQSGRGTGVQKFDLNLSGFQLRAGVAVKL